MAVLKYSSNWWKLYGNLQNLLASIHHTITSRTCQGHVYKSMLIRVLSETEKTYVITNRSMHRPRRCTHNCPTLDHQLLPSIPPMALWYLKPCVMVFLILFSKNLKVYVPGLLLGYLGITPQGLTATRGN